MDCIFDTCLRFVYVLPVLVLPLQKYQLFEKCPATDRSFNDSVLWLRRILPRVSMSEKSFATLGQLKSDQHISTYHTSFPAFHHSLQRFQQEILARIAANIARAGRWCAGRVASSNCFI